jgi:carotenoid cleavage dioxygenase-like enzyme
MVKHKNIPFRFIPEHGSRIGVLPFTAKYGSEMIWYNLPAFMIFHTANAWEEKDGTIKVRLRWGLFWGKVLGVRVLRFRVHVGV